MLSLKDANGTNCYMEVVSWDNSGNVAEIHAKVPAISSSVPTVLTLAPSGGSLKIT